MIYRGPGDRLDEAARRMLQSVESRLLVPLEGLHLDEVAALAATLGTGSLDDDAVPIGCTRVPAGIRCTCARC